MGFFSKKQKEYSLSEAMQLVKGSKYRDYAPVPVDFDDPNTKYKLVPEAEAMQEERERRKNRQQADEFMSRINGNGSYQGIKISNSYGTTNVNRTESFTR